MDDDNDSWAELLAQGRRMVAWEREFRAELLVQTNARCAEFEQFCLPTGEHFELRENVRNAPSHRWEAIAQAPELPGPSDRHGAGPTPQAAVRELSDYVSALHALAKNGQKKRSENDL